MRKKTANVLIFSLNSGFKQQRRNMANRTVAVKKRWTLVKYGKEKKTTTQATGKSTGCEGGYSRRKHIYV